jgi:NhaP-type Na+/H+ or K+/H+ antiporter
MLLAYFLMLFLLGGNAMLPEGAGWSLILVYACSVVCGAASEKMKVPALLGMLASGIVLKNLPGGLVEGLPSSWAAAIRAGGLACILMRSGLEMDVPAIKRIGMVAVRLTCLPGMLEAVACGFAAMVIFGMKPALGISLGFILAAVSPAVVVVGMFRLQKVIPPPPPC